SDLLINDTRPCFILVSLGRSKERDKEAQVIDQLLVNYSEYFQVLEFTIGGNQRTPATWPIKDILSAENFLKDLLIFQLPWYGWIKKDGSIELDIQKPSLKLEERLFSIRAREREKNKIKVGQ
ncbi:MAG: hypothetical protein MK086_04640, partial [Flavobacteriales bacterium]|nr:hypothetical protein [Flavobacteriales bacterium]